MAGGGRCYEVGRETQGAVLRVKNNFPICAYVILFIGVIFKSNFMVGPMMKSTGELTEWNWSEWHCRGYCDDCQVYRVLAKVAGGDLCENCDFERMIGAEGVA